MLLYAKPAHVARPDEKNGTALPQSMTYQPYTSAPKGGKALPHHDIRNHRASCVMGGSGDDFRKDGLMACGPAGRTAPAAPAAGGQTGQRRRLAPPHFGPLSGNQGPGRTRQPAASRAISAGRDTALPSWQPGEISRTPGSPPGSFRQQAARMVMRLLCFRSMVLEPNTPASRISKSSASLSAFGSSGGPQTM